MLITYFYSMTFSNTMTLSSNKRKRDEAYTKSHNESEAAKEITDYRIKNQNDSIILAHLKHIHFDLDGKTKHSPKYNNTSVMTVFRKHSEQQLKSKFMPVIGYTKSRQHVGAKQNSFLLKSDRRKLRKKATGKQINPYKALYVPKANHTSCAISFDTDSLLKARNQLQQKRGYYLFYVNITINGFKDPEIDDDFEEKLDQLTHWQYVRKEEKFMVQLPVDFDLLTYNMLVYDHEETTLNIRLVYDSINCTEEQLLDKNESVRSLLWNTLFDNNKNYYLCNRVFFKPVYGRDVLYGLTTIWVGYDLNCSAVSRNGSFISMEIEKDHLPLVAPIFCYILSLQFIWIFVLLDLNDDPEDSTEAESTSVNINDDQSAQNSNTDPPNTAHLRPTTDIKGSNTRLKHYSKSDRPYGIKRFMVKLLYAPCCCKETYSETCLGQTCTWICKVWSNPFKRLTILMWLFVLLPFGLYRTIVRFSLKKMYNNYHTVVRTSEPLIYLAKCSEDWALALDSIYATLCPIIYVYLGQILYETHLKDDLRLCSCFKQKDEDQSLIISNKKIRDRFTFRYVQFCKTLDASCCVDEDGNCNCKCFMCCKNSINFLLALMYCFFPMFSFSCFGYKSKCCKDKSNILDCILNIVGFLILYVFCLRPIISTFTFLFRSFTYFVFVALPIRVHILRYTMVIVTTVVYFIKYFHEIVNMNSDILEHIFTCEENTQNDNEASLPIEAIEEEMFDYIYERLLFVRSSMHFLYMKMIVIFMYLFITIETFITNQSSLTGSGFKDILEFLLIIIGPYAITLVLKSSKDNFLTEENKTEIEKEHKNFKTQKLEKDKQKHSLSDGPLPQTESSTDINLHIDSKSHQLHENNVNEDASLLENDASKMGYSTL